MARKPGSGWRRLPFVVIIDDIRRYLRLRKM
jgi:hypothetical protein